MEQENTVWKWGILTVDGARRLGVPHLAGFLVEYQPRYVQGVGECVGEIFSGGFRLGSTLCLGSSGILPVDWRACQENGKPEERG